MGEVTGVIIPLIPYKKLVMHSHVMSHLSVQYCQYMYWPELENRRQLFSYLTMLLLLSISVELIATKYSCLVANPSVYKYTLPISYQVSLVLC
jgi:hypothetical protein